MSLFRRRTESRSGSFDVPFSQGGAITHGSDPVLSLVPVFAAIRTLADEISTLPLDAFRRGLNGQPDQQITTPQLLQHPAAVGDLQTWIATAVVGLAGRGNAFGFTATRDGFGYPADVEWLAHERVTVDEARPTAPIYYVDGRRVASEDITHVPWFVMPGRVVGLSPIEVLQATVAVGRGAQQYRADWFSNGGVPPGVFKNTAKTVDQGEADVMKQRLTAAIRKHQPIVHGNDWEYESITLPADSAEFVATMRMTANQVASAYGLPPTRIGGGAGGLADVLQHGAGSH